MMKKEFAPVTPGEMLKEEFLAEYGLLQRSQTTPWFDARWKQPASSSSKRPRCSALVKAPRKAHRARKDRLPPRDLGQQRWSARAVARRCSARCIFQYILDNRCGREIHSTSESTYKNDSQGYIISTVIVIAMKSQSPSNVS